MTQHPQPERTTQPRLQWAFIISALLTLLVCIAAEMAKAQEPVAPSTAPAYTTVTQQGRVVTTVREEALPQPAGLADSEDVNARDDAGVIITHPVTSTTPVRSNATGGVGIYTHINP